MKVKRLVSIGLALFLIIWDALGFYELKDKAILPPHQNWHLPHVFPRHHGGGFNYYHAICYYAFQNNFTISSLLG